MCVSGCLQSNGTIKSPALLMQKLIVCRYKQRHCRTAGLFFNTDLKDVLVQ